MTDTRTPFAHPSLQTLGNPSCSRGLRGGAPPRGLAAALTTVAAALALVTPTVASAREYELNPVASSVSIDGAMTMTAREVDLSRGDFTMIVTFRNDSDVMLVMHTPDFRCQRGGFEMVADGGVIGERWLDLEPNETKTYGFTCDHGDQVSGPVGLVIPGVYVNPNGDGRTTGKPIAQDIVFRLREGDLGPEVQHAGQSVACVTYRRPAPATVAVHAVVDDRPLAIPGPPEPPPPAGAEIPPPPAAPAAVPAVPGTPPPPPPPAATLRPHGG